MTNLLKRLRDFGLIPSLIGILGALTVGVTIFGFFGTWGWLPELASHFRLQYGGALALAAIALAMLRRFRVALIFAVFALANFSLLAPLFFGGPGPVPPGAPRIKFLQMNVRTENENYEAVRQLIKLENPDVVALDEVNVQWLTELTELAKLYPFQLVLPREDNFGIALFSRIPFSDSQILHLGDSVVESLAVTMAQGGQTLMLLCTHPLPPGTPATADMRNRQLAGIAQWVKTQTTPVVVIGDLNATPWSPYFKKLLVESGLRNSAQGYGLQTTWPANFPLLSIPIDHCLLGAGLEAVAHRIGPDVGSDHYPLIVEVAITGPGKAKSGL